MQFYKVTIITALITIAMQYQSLKHVRTSSFVKNCVRWKMIYSLTFKSGLAVTGNLVHENNHSVTLKIHCSSPYAQVRNYLKEDIKSIEQLKTARKGLARRILEELKEC